MTQPATGTGHQPDPVRVAWAWVDHVRSGGGTPWREYAARVARGPALPPEDATLRGRLPGAAQLELARRLAARAGELAASGTPVEADPAAELLGRALDRSGPGRGLAVLPLDLSPAGASSGVLAGGPAGGLAGGTATARVGAPPTDPADVPVGELVRLAVGLLVDEVLRSGHGRGPGGPGAGPEDRPDVGPDDGGEASGRSRARSSASGGGLRALLRRPPLARRVAVVGAAVDAARLRASGPALRARPGRPVPVLVVAAPLPDLLAQAWSARVQHGAGVPWERFVRRCARRDALPASADLAALTAAQAARAGTDRVHVLAAEDPAATAAAAEEALGSRAVWVPPQHGPGLRPLGAAGVDVLRRVNQVLAVRLPRDRRAGVRRTVADLLPSDPAGPRLALPAAHADWAAARAERLAADLTRGGYPVHGDPGRVAVRPGGPERPRRADVLDLLLDALLAVGPGSGPAAGAVAAAAEVRDGDGSRRR